MLKYLLTEEEKEKIIAEHEGPLAIMKLGRENETKRMHIIEQHMLNGVHMPIYDGIIISPSAVIGKDTYIYSQAVIGDNVTVGEGCVIFGNTYLENCTIGDNTVIYPNTFILNNSKIGSNVKIMENSHIEDATIGDSCVIKATWITSSVLEEDVEIGPYSQVRPDCHISKGVRIGDFVEIKNSNVGENTHASHLTYIGDTDCGKRVNFGCGVATANYNGREKNRTKIGDDCFIGCNTNLVAPVTIEDGAYTAAGSTVTVTVPEDAVCIARAREVIKEKMALKYRKDK